MPSAIDIHKFLHLFVYDPRDPLYFSTSFFLFLLFGVLLLYRLFVNNKSLRIFTIIFFSVFFYYKITGVYFYILFLSTLLNFLFGKWIYDSKSNGLRKFIFVSALILNLGVLGYFKYTNFFIQIINDIHSGNIQPLDIFLPVGISFYTFKALSYVIEIYMGMMEPTKSFRDFCAYMFFFANILAGPIDRASAFLPQLEGEIKVTKSDIGRGIFLIMTGLFKKNIIADYIGLNFVDRVFGSPLRFTGVENLLATYAYVMQIYCDFSGYTDMALGIASLFGFKLMDNFNQPFKASSVADYWRRWHISLSTWLLDYLFKPLQMKFRNWRVYGSALAIFITFIAVGIWHGANWTFVVFGLFHSTFLAFSLLTAKYKKSFFDKVGLSNTKVLKFFQIFFTFHLLMFTAILFRAPSLTYAWDMVHQIFTFFHGAVFFQFVPAYFNVFILMMLGYVLHFIPKSVDNMLQKIVTNMPVLVQASLLVLMIWLVIQVESAQLQPVIYFNF